MSHQAFATCTYDNHRSCAALSVCVRMSNINDWFGLVPLDSGSLQGPLPVNLVQSAEGTHS